MSTVPGGFKGVNKRELWSVAFDFTLNFAFSIYPDNSPALFVEGKECCAFRDFSLPSKRFSLPLLFFVVM